MVWQTDIFACERGLEERHVKPICPNIDLWRVHGPVKYVVVDDWVFKAETPSVLFIGQVTNSILFGVLSHNRSSQSLTLTKIVLPVRPISEDFFSKENWKKRIELYCKSTVKA